MRILFFLMLTYVCNAQAEIPKNSNRIYIESDYTLAEVARILVRDGYFIDTYLPEIGYVDTEWLPTRYKKSQNKRKFMVYKEDSVFILSGLSINSNIEVYNSFSEISKSGGYLEGAFYQMQQIAKMIGDKITYKRIEYKD